jgi:hypothetical protein
LRATLKIVLHLSLAATLVAAAPSSSTAPAIDVYTMGPGDMLFHRFGHAAICTTYDDARRKSRCYNYGTTDFGSPPSELGWSFVRGNSPFWVSVWKPDRMIREYEQLDRSVWRQRIPMPPARAREVAARLKADAARYDGKSPEAVYAYHHFDDNCTTRVRDIVDEATDGELRRGTELSVGATYRVLGRRGLADQTAIIVLDHFFAGREVDVEPTLWEAMFLPKYMREGITNRLGAEPELIYERRAPLPPEEGRSGRGWLALIAMLVFLPVAITDRVHRARRVGLAVTGGVISLVGIALLFIMVLSDMPELRYNEALLVFWPTDFMVAVLGPRLRRSYARIRLASLAIVCIGMAAGVVRQPLLVPLLIPLLSHAFLATRGVDAVNRISSGR